MSTPKAARGGSITNHRGVLETAQGVSNVTINSQPAWVSGSAHDCPAHGAEDSPTGSETVLVGGRRLHREGDFLLGKGAPNRIEIGSANVAVGSPRLAGVDGESVSDFCAGYCKLKREWEHLKPEERRARYEQLVAGLFAEFGAPPPHVIEAETNGASAAWNDRAWAIELPAGAFEGKTPPSSGATIHEARHAQQTFTALRFLATNGPAGREPTLEELEEQTSVPPSVIAQALASPVNPHSAEGRFGRLMAAEFYTPEGRRELSDVITRAGSSDPATRDAAIDAYRARPLGQDAIATTSAFKCSC